MWAALTNLLNPKRRLWDLLIYSWSVRNIGDNLDLWLALEVGWEGQSWRTEPSIFGSWHYLRVDRVRIEMNFRTPADIEELFGGEGKVTHHNWVQNCTWKLEVRHLISCTVVTLFGAKLLGSTIRPHRNQHFLSLIYHLPGGNRGNNNTVESIFLPTQREVQKAMDWEKAWYTQS